MPQPGEIDPSTGLLKSPTPGDKQFSDIKFMPSSPSVSLQLHQEFAVFRSTMLTDIKSLLQAALQEVLDQHEVLIKSQEQTIQDALSETVVQITTQIEQGGMAKQETMGLASNQWNQTAAWAGSAGGDFTWKGHKETTWTEPVDATEPLELSLADRAANVRGARKSRAAKGDPLDEPIEIGSLQLKAGKGSATGMAEDSRMFCKNKRFLKDGKRIDEVAYDVSQCYYEIGCCQSVTKSEWFNNVTLVMIVVNAVYMGVEADKNHDDPTQSLPVFQYLDNIFCAFFFTELMLRFFSFEVKMNAWRDQWFKFDFILAGMMVIETWVLALMVTVGGMDTSSMGSGTEFIRLMRLLRLARMTRIMRALPELVTMVRGMVVACRAVFSALFCLVLIIYVFAIIMHTFLKGYEMLEGRWSTVSECMWTLLVAGLFFDGMADEVRDMANLNEGVALCCYLAFVLLSATTVMNMLIGILCEVVNQVAIAEKENAARNEIRTHLLGMLQRLDSDGSGDINKEELLGVLLDPEAMIILEDLAVDIPHFLELQDMIFDKPESVLSISQIMNMILEYRGDRDTKMNDLVHAQEFLTWSIKSKMDKQLSALQDHNTMMMAQMSSAMMGGAPPPTFVASTQEYIQKAGSNGVISSFSNWMGNGEA